MWRVVDTYIQAMPQKFVAAKRKYLAALLGPRESERWSNCLSVMWTFMDMSLGRLFVDAAFDDSSKNTVSFHLSSKMLDCVVSLLAVR